jgi:hypothetical protein
MNVTFTRHTDPSPLLIEALDEGAHATALADAQHVLRAGQTAPLDAVIHGVRVRLHTDNPHWKQFWSANWFAPDQWAALTGQTPPREPQVHVYAIAHESQTGAWAGYNQAHQTAFLMGDAPYGPLRALALGAVGRLLAEEQAVHWIPGSLIRQQNRGMLILPTSGADAAVRLMESPDAHLVAWDGVFVRYGLVRMVDGVTLLPTAVIDEKGCQTAGYRLFPWLDQYGYVEPRADARCLTLNGQEEYCFARDLDLGRAPEALAFPLEQTWYVPTALVETQPHLVEALRGAALENVPPLTPDVLTRYGDWARQVAPPGAAQAWGFEATVGALCRLRATPHARAMIAPARLWPGRAGGHPWQPLQIEHMMGVDLAALPAYLLDATPLPGADRAGMINSLAGVLAQAVGG